MAARHFVLPTEAQLRGALDSVFERLENPKKGKVLIIDGADSLPAGHVCTMAAHTLRETPLKLLPGGRVAKGACTTLITLLPAAPAYSVILLVRDLAGTAGLVSLRNWQPTAGKLSVTEAGAMLPAGTQIRVLEPYLMINATGGGLLRADNPANIQILSRPGLTLDAAGSPAKAEALALAAKAAGDAHAATDRPAAAIELFTAGLDLGDLVSPALRSALHANRAAAALSLRRWAAALLDCDRAIAADASNGSAALLRCTALLRVGRVESAIAFATEQLARRAEDDAAAAAGAGGAGAPRAAAGAAATSASAAGGIAAARAASDSDSAAAFKGYAEGLLRRAREAEAMRGGRFDLMSIPFSMEGESIHGTATYVGPIAVRDTRTRRGWGAFLTRDVKKGELLLLERPLFVRYSAFDDPVNKQVPGEETPDGGLTAGLTYLVQSPGADADGQVAAKLATLHSVAGPRWATEPPSEAALRGEALLPVPPPGILTAKHIRGIVEANSFGARGQLEEPTPAQRQPFAWSFDADAAPAVAAVRAFAESQLKKATLKPSTPLQAAALADVLADTGSKEKGTSKGKGKGKGKGGPVVKDVTAAVSLSAATAGTAGSASAAATTPSGGGAILESESAASSSAGGAGIAAAADSERATTQLQQLLASMSPVERAATIDAQDSNGMAALHFAVEYGRLEDVQALLAAGANTNLFDRRGRTPVHVAAGFRCDDAILRALLDAGANVNAVAPGTFTPLQEAVRSPVERSARMVVMLLHRGADPFILAGNGDSLLHVLHSEECEDDRDVLAATVHAWPAKVALLEASGCSRARYEGSFMDGSALYWVASFINHADPRSSGVNTQRVNIGGLMVIRAERDMRAGTELTTVYAVNEENLRSRGVK